MYDEDNRRREQPSGGSAWSDVYDEDRKSHSSSEVTGKKLPGVKAIQQVVKERPILVFSGFQLFQALLHISFNVSYQDHRVLFLKLKKRGFFLFHTKKIK